MALGMMVPAAFAATNSSNSMQWEQQYIGVSGQQTGFKGFAANYAGSPTTYMPIWYVDHALQAMGFTVSWTGNDLLINNSNVKAPTNPMPGSGPNGIYLNGVLVQNTTVMKAVDPASKVETTYMPIYFVLKVLQEVGVAQTSDWNGSTLTMTAPTPVSTTTGFSNFTVSGAQTGAGTVTSPAVSSNGGAVTLSTVLSDSNGNPVANSAVNVTVTGSAGDTPVVQGNGTYLTTTANATTGATSWTATVNTDASGKLALSIVGTGAYTVTITSANNSSATTEGYVNFLGTNGLLTPSGTSGAGYGVNISTPTSPSAGVQAVTFTLPLSSSGTVQANTEVTFTLTDPTGATGFFSTSTGSSLGTNTLTAYSNANGQATVYVNDYQTDANVEVSAVVTGSAVTPATTYLTYSNPAAPSSTAPLNNIGVFAFQGAIGTAGTTSPSSVAGLPVTQSVYYAPVDGNGAVYGYSDGSVTYTLNATNSANIAGLSLYTTNSSTTPATSGFTSVTLPSSLANASSITLQFMVNSAGTGYDVYANGVNITPTTANVLVTNAEFGVTMGDANATASNSTLTVTSGSVSATAGYVFNGSTPEYVSNFTPVLSTISAGGTANVTFQVDDSSGAPVKNSAVRIGLASAATQGYWITAVNGTQLTMANGTTTEYTPIPLNGNASDTAGSGAASGAISYSTFVPGVANWGSGNGYFTAYTDANGDVTLTVQNGDVWAYIGATYGNQLSSTTVTGSVYAFTDPMEVNAGTDGVLQFTNTVTPGNTFTESSTATSPDSVGTQVGQIDN